MNFLAGIDQKRRAVRSLSRGDWATLAHAWPLLLLTDLGLRRLPFARIQTLLSPDRGIRRRGAATRKRGRPKRVAWLVDVAARHHLYQMGCLRRALVLGYLLGREGMRSELRIGVRRSEAGLTAHAWLEYQGAALGEPQEIESRFAPLLSREAREAEQSQAEALATVHPQESAGDELIDKP